ncbi:hypothetical protein OAS19_06165 [Altererythrobacter sp.]|nr:hypothetical protein [Altererythrobacter sp.]
MLLYAWGCFREGELQLVGSDESLNLATLLASVLNVHTHRLMRQGLDRGYVDVTEESRTIRGRLLLGEMAKRQTLALRGTAVCEFDELTPDILHNQILFETIVRLSKSSRVERKVRHELGLTANRFRDVSRINVTADLFRRVQLSRNTAQYGLLMHICELIFHELMPDTEGATGRFKSLAEDQIRMSTLFEEFLRNFYRAELSGCTVSGTELTWAATASSEADLAFLPKMLTDITVKYPDRVLVIDAKYYQSVLETTRWGAEKLKPQNLFQLNTYLSHVALAEPNLELQGMLLYAQTGEPLDLRYSLLGRPVRIATVNLGAEWQKIHEHLLQLAQ